jgi:hypothetical protein
MHTLMDTAVQAAIFWDIIQPWQLIAMIVLVVVIVVLMKIRNKQM